MRPPASAATSTCSGPDTSRVSVPGANGCNAASIGAALVRSFAIGMHGGDAPLRVVAQLRDFDRAKMGNAAGQDRVVVVQPPAATELDDRVMRGPSHDR